LSVKEFLYNTYGFPKVFFLARPPLFPSQTLFSHQPPVVVRSWETVEHVLLKIHVHNVHRVWVVNEKQNPVGVISLTDLIRFFLAN